MVPEAAGIKKVQAVDQYCFVSAVLRPFSRVWQNLPVGVAARPFVNFKGGKHEDFEKSVVKNHDYRCRKPWAYGGGHSISGG